MSPILAVTRHGIRSWWKDRRSMVLGLLTPVLLFISFSFIFSNRKEMPKLEVAWVDLDQSQASERLTKLVQHDGTIRTYQAVQLPLESQKTILNAENVKPLIQAGKISLAVVLLPGLNEQVMQFKHWKESFVRIYYDPTEKMQANLLKGLLTKAGFLLVSEIWGESSEFRDPENQKKIDPRWAKFTSDLSRAFRESSQLMRERGENALSESFIPLTLEEIKGRGKVNVAAAQQLAGVAVMFLLFSVARAGGVLLEEKNGGTLKRILAAPISIYQLMLGKLFSSASNGAVQISVLCLVGWLFFKIAVFQSPFALLCAIFATSICAASFGLFFASFCQTSEQVQYLAVLLILSMSLIGGSIVPKFLLPEWAQKLSVFTLNGWAMDGFLKLFIHGAGISGIALDIFMLLLLALFFMAATFFLLPRRLYL